MINDSLGALCPFHNVYVAGAHSGPLLGTTFAAKDNFHVAGHRTGVGSPEFLADHPPAETTAFAISALIEAGATLVGKTHSDELCFSLEGENVHYGTPINPNAPGRIPGGSSSGSASAVAGSLVDFAIGTDAGGSVRLPASLCGVYGIRPSYGRIAADGTVPLAPSVGTVGWFARDAKLFSRIGSVLLGDDERMFRMRRVLIADDALALIDEEVTAALKPAIRIVTHQFEESVHVTACPEGIKEWLSCLRVIQGFEAWQSYGQWITTRKPKLGPGIADRFAWASTINPELIAPARERRRTYAEGLYRLLGDDSLLLLPTSPNIAPKRGSLPRDLEKFRLPALTLLGIAGVSGVPQVSIPAAKMNGCPLGLSLIAPRGADRALLSLVEELDLCYGT